MHRRSFLAATAALIGAPALSLTAKANDGPIRIVVGFAPGGSTDALARLVADIISKQTGRTAIVENKPGAGGRIAVDSVKSAAATGDTLLVCPQGPMTLFPHVFKDLRYKPDDFAPIARIGVSDLALCVGPAAPSKTVAEFQNWVRKHEDQATFGSAGNGTLIHFCGVAATQRLGIQMTHVPYKGIAPAMVDLVGGNIAAGFSPVTEALELHKTGRIRMLATMGAQRSSFVPDVPTLRELGFDFELQTWQALYGPAGMPASAVAKLNTVIDTELASPKGKERLINMGVEPAPMTPQQIVTLRDKESELWASVARSVNFKANS